MIRLSTEISTEGKIVIRKAEEMELWQSSGENRLIRALIRHR